MQQQKKSSTLIEKNEKVAESRERQGRLATLVKEFEYVVDKSKKEEMNVQWVQIEGERMKESLGITNFHYEKQLDKYGGELEMSG